MQDLGPQPSFATVGSSSGPADDSSSDSASVAKKKKKKKNSGKALARYCKDLCQEARDGGLSPVRFH